MDEAKALLNQLSESMAAAMERIDALEKENTSLKTENAQLRAATVLSKPLFKTPPKFTGSKRQTDSSQIASSQTVIGDIVPRTPLQPISSNPKRKAKTSLTQAQTKRLKPTPITTISSSPSLPSSPPVRRGSREWWEQQNRQPDFGELEEMSDLN